MSREFVQKLPPPTPEVLAEIIEKVQCPIDKGRRSNVWAGYVPLGSLANGLINKGYNPLGVLLELENYAVEKGIICTKDNKIPTIGIYKIVGLPNKSKSAPKIEYIAIKKIDDNKEYYVAADRWVFKPVQNIV